jgi:arylsulfatase A-like enzyme
MLSGYGVETHGLVWNDYLPSRGYIRSVTLFGMAQRAGFRTVMVVAKQKLIHIASPGTVDEFVYIPGGDFAVAEAAVARIESDFGVLFVHLPGPDSAGHRYGWMSPAYLSTVANSDQAVGRLLDAVVQAGLEGKTLIILTADHGGHNRTHGSARAEDTTIPWVVAGPGVVPDLALTTPVATYDTAATAAWALGLPLPEDMLGRPVLEAFEDVAGLPRHEVAVALMDRFGLEGAAVAVGMNVVAVTAASTRR